MKFRVGIENNNEGIRTIAWLLEHPGCFAYGSNQQQAIDNVPAAIDEYAVWITGHGGTWLSPGMEIEVYPEQVWTDYQINEEFDRVEQDGYEINPFFDHDWKPLTTTDIERGLQLLAWSRADLMTTLERLTPRQWTAKIAGERWDVAGIVNHIGGAEWWYLDRLGLAFPRADVPEEPLPRLEKVRTLLNQCLPAFRDAIQVVGKDGEFWSPRKVLRRALWHERDHRAHIQKVLLATQQLN
jgi:uncharacterized damage-inducible protein DinB